MLILDLLSLARIESGEEQFEFEAVAGAGRRPRLPGTALGESRRPATDVGIGGRYADCRRWANTEAVEQILDNLLDNALKYTPQGGHSPRRLGQENGQVWLRSPTTASASHGRPAAYSSAFYRVDKARLRGVGGTGLGLYAIVKHLTQAMKGNVQAASRVGRAATFTVRLPRATAETDPFDGGSPSRLAESP